MSRAFPFLRKDLDGIGIVVSSADTVALPRIGRAPTAEDIYFLQKVDVRIADEGEMKGADVPTSTGQ